MSHSQTHGKIYVAGHRGMVGSAIIRNLLAAGCPPENILTRTHAELDLISQADVRDFFATARPDQVYLAAARVGGIHANNTYPADFIYENIMMQSNVIDAAFRSGAKKLLFLGSSCIYPKFAPQPIGEASLLTGALEPTNEPYAVAKIAGIKMCESYNRQYGRSHGLDYRSIMPTNLYGVGDNYHSENSHVIPALIRRFHEAKIQQLPEVMIWGTGTPQREFLYVDDMASASVHLMNLDQSIYQALVSPMQTHVNAGYGSDISIRDLAVEIARCVAYAGAIAFDTSKPDGPPRKLVDSSVLTGMGWKPGTSLAQGLAKTYEDFLGHNHRE